MEEEPPCLQPAFACRCHADHRAEPDPPTSWPLPLGGRDGAVAPPARQRHARGRLSPPCPQPTSCRIHLVTRHHPRTTTAAPPRRRFSSSLNYHRCRSSSMPRHHRNWLAGTPHLLTVVAVPFLSTRNHKLSLIHKMWRG
uniref:Uncharacterized protein n=1 Tax=Oryza meridionalis TaxID=40149 RepID=A0A0E0FBI6_9ORYZ